MSKTKKARKISVAIPTYNTWPVLGECIESMQKQTLKPDEIIVIDNASTDDTVSEIKNKFSDVKLVEMKENTGVTGGRNAGIKNAKKNTDYIFFFDSDMIADKNMLEELVKVAELDDTVGIVTPKIYYWEEKDRIWAAGTAINLWTGQVLFRGGKDKGQYEKVEEVQVAPAALLVKRDVINKIKKFDDRYFATYEDTDFCFRARREGYRTMFTPNAVARHKLSTDAEKEAERLLSRGYLVGRNRVLFMRDFANSFLIFLLFLPVYALYYLRLAIKYRNPRGWWLFMEGTVSGLLDPQSPSYWKT